MNLSPHFTMAEFVASATAAQRGIDNSLPPELLTKARATCDMLERIRDALSSRAAYTVPINLSSGYRCLALNTAVGSGKGSDHLRAEAADFTASSFGTPLQICRVLAPLVSVLGIGQLIYECPTATRRWVHVSTRLPSKLMNRVITIGPGGPVLGIQEG